MERMLTPEERIRRAEDIYQRRKMQNLGVRVTSTTNHKQANKKDFGLLKKMALQILICLVIYFIYYLVQNSNYIFSDEVMKRTQEILSKDINFSVLYEQGMNYWNEVINKTQKQEDQKQEENKQENQQENVPTGEENIGGAAEGTESTPPEEPTQEDSQKPLSQMEIDANEIKAKYSLIKPITGTITSRYGYRNPTTATVPKNHTGIDIAANKGTVIYAALDGVVQIASSEGDYGNHLKIGKDDVSIVYAHCDKLYLKQGDVVKQGDPIAEVGATGNVTGPHLHFEIRKQERYVDPDLIMQF